MPRLPQSFLKKPGAEASGAYEDLSQCEVFRFRQDRVHRGDPLSFVQVGLETYAAYQRGRIQNAAERPRVQVILRLPTSLRSGSNPRPFKARKLLTSTNGTPHQRLFNLQLLRPALDRRRQAE